MTLSRPLNIILRGYQPATLNAYVTAYRVRQMFHDDKRRLHYKIFDFRCIYTVLRYHHAVEYPNMSIYYSV